MKQYKASAKVKPKPKHTSPMAEIVWLVKHRREQVQIVVNDFRNLTVGRRNEYGPLVSWFVSVLEDELSKLKSKKTPKKGAKKP